MFSKILVANRGEIACRIIRTINEMGIESVAVFSDADINSEHVALADAAVNIGSAKVDQSYLRGEIIIKAALQEGADAIHPGYGFLSENSDFVEAVEAAGLVFIGPPASAIKLMGFKDKAKKLMSQSKVPVVPGYNGIKQDDTFLAAEADKIGYPVMIKAIAGGGGKGMRLVKTKSAFFELLSLARSEALSAFGNDTVLIEKFVKNPRHIEVQIFGDCYGNIIHLYERDCSLQRRHQKVIEEAPAPKISENVRKKLYTAAINAAKAIEYVGAGTVEFICESASNNTIENFWFMEMNTRLQVEHPITEEITGLNLVEWQIRVAAGEPLPKTQDEIKITGHSFEARLYAEDPCNHFLPTTGVLNHIFFPNNVRVDSGIRVGDEVTPFYDPLIAKIIVHGKDRRSALKKLRKALIETEIGGSITNLNFLYALSNDQQFADVKFDTQLIDYKLDALIKKIEIPNTVKVLSSLAVLGLDNLSDPFSGFSLWEPIKTNITMEFGQVSVRVFDKNNFGVEISGRDFLVNREGWSVDGVKSGAKFLIMNNQITIFFKGAWYFKFQDKLNPKIETKADGNSIIAPMPGFVKVINVKVGDSIREGDLLVIQEAMKMEHTLLAHKDGIVVKVEAVPGQQVEAGKLLIELDPSD
jgi:3-methylcrotonyl-CoA carboxylase alpha subunit